MKKIVKMENVYQMGKDLVEDMQGQIIDMIFEAFWKFLPAAVELQGVTDVQRLYDKIYFQNENTNMAICITVPYKSLYFIPSDTYKNMPDDENSYYSKMYKNGRDFLNNSVRFSLKSAVNHLKNILSQNFTFCDTDVRVYLNSGCINVEFTVNKWEFQFALDYVEK